MKAGSKVLWGIRAIGDDTLNSWQWNNLEERPEDATALLTAAMKHAAAGNRQFERVRITIEPM